MDASPHIWANQPIQWLLVGWLQFCLQETNVRVVSPQPPSRLGRFAHQILVEL